MQWLPGLLISAFAAGIASFASSQIGVSAAACAIVVAFLMMAFVQSPSYQSGLCLAAGPILKLAIPLLGVRLSFQDMAGLGVEPFAVVAITMAAGLGFSFGVARLIGLPLAFGWTGARTVGVCGVSAAMPASSTLPKSREIERDADR